MAGLFAGVGGLELGFKQAGFHASLLAEIDSCARSVLADRFPGSRIVDDVTALERIPTDTQVVTAGFPCQDLSPPGSKAGIEGAKSGLVAHVFRLLAKSNDVEWLVLENVPFMLRLAGGSAMSRIVDELEALGWRWAYRTVDAICAVPQRRRRVILVASPCHDPASAIFGDNYPSPDERSWTPGESVGFYWTEGRSGAGLRREAVPTLKVGSSLGIPSAPAILNRDGSLGMPSIADAERLQGFPGGWTAAAEGRSRGSRWRLVGNAVPPPLAAWVARSIARPPGVADSVRFDDLILKGGWPSAACGDGHTRRSAKIGEGFIEGPRPMLSQALSDLLTPLSPRALNGFLSRARSGGLRWPEGFLDRLSAYA